MSFTVEHAKCGTAGCVVREERSQATRYEPSRFLGESAWCPTCQVSFHPPEAKGQACTGLRFDMKTIPMTPKPGARVGIVAGSRVPSFATHEITGRDGGYLLICPIGKLDEIEPGQYWTPVTRITEERLRIF